MQPYWMLYEYTDDKQKERGVIRGYGFCRNYKDAVGKASLTCTTQKYKLLRIWLTHLDAAVPCHTLIYGDKPASGLERMEPDNATRAVIKSSKESKGVGKKQKRELVESANKPRIKLKHDTPPVKEKRPEAARFYLYSVRMSNDYKPPSEEVR